MLATCQGDYKNPRPTADCRRKTGYGNYGPAAGAKGARIIRLRQGQSAALSTTWIRTEDGQRLDQDSMLVLPEAKRAQSACGASACWDEGWGCPGGRGGGAGGTRRFDSSWLSCNCLRRKISPLTLPGPQCLSTLHWDFIAGSLGRQHRHRHAPSCVAECFHRNLLPCSWRPCLLADAWLWQRLHDRSVVKLIIVCAAGGLGLVAASAALTALLMRWRQRASCKAPTGSIWEDEERAFLRSPASSGSTTP